MAIAIAGTHSGVGKTTITLAILAALRQRGLNIQSFKVGPDYIDPMFHSQVTGRPCRNLDAVLTAPEYVQACFAQHSMDADGSVIEGVMGLFDGAGGSEFASTAHVAKLLGKSVAVILVVDCSRASRSIAATIYGFQNFDPDLQLAGVILNRVGSDRHRELLLEAIAPLGIPIMGIVPRSENIKLSDRHLGLIPTAEVDNFNAISDQLAEMGARYLDWQLLMPLIQQPAIANQAWQSTHDSQSTAPRIAIARDRAFNFYYVDNLDALEQAGAELVFWSPLEDSHLPENIQGMYFGGGFPEVFAAELSANQGAIASVRHHSHLPIYAECGGLMYLSTAITDFSGEEFAMVGKLPTKTIMTEKLTLGYRHCQPLYAHDWLTSKQKIWGHEFHRSKQITASAQPLFDIKNYNGESFGIEGWHMHDLFASYVHLHWGYNFAIAQKFVDACKKQDN